MGNTDDKELNAALPNKLSRRDLIKGVIAGGVAVSSASYLFRASTLLGQSTRGAGERLLTINVNGQLRRADVMRQETLAWTLRHKLGLTGTKLGCDRAECGSCTVLIDDVPLLRLFGSDTHRARRQGSDHRRPGEPRRKVASCSAGCHRRARLPMCLLHAGFHHGLGRIPEDKSQSHTKRTGAGPLGKPLPVPGLRQNLDRDDAGS